MNKIILIEAKLIVENLTSMLNTLFKSKNIKKVIFDSFGKKNAAKAQDILTNINKADASDIAKLQKMSGYNRFVEKISEDLLSKHFERNGVNSIKNISDTKRNEIIANINKNFKEKGYTDNAFYDDIREGLVNIFKKTDGTISRSSLKKIDTNPEIEKLLKKYFKVVDGKITKTMRTDINLNDLSMDELYPLLSKLYKDVGLKFPKGKFEDTLTRFYGKMGRMQTNLEYEHIIRLNKIYNMPLGNQRKIFINAFGNQSYFQRILPESLYAVYNLTRKTFNYTMNISFLKNVLKWWRTFAKIALASHVLQNFAALYSGNWEEANLVKGVAELRQKKLTEFVNSNWLNLLIPLVPIGKNSLSIFKMYVDENILSNTSIKQYFSFNNIDSNYKDLISNDGDKFTVMYLEKTCRLVSKELFMEKDEIMFKDEDNKNITLVDYFNTVVDRKNSCGGNITENIDERISLSSIIDEKLREINFYSVDTKKEQTNKKIIDFTDSDRKQIKNFLEYFIEKYPKDIAFIKAVVLAKGLDKKTNEPVVRLGSFEKSSSINLPFKTEGLGNLLNGSIQYFTISNNKGPDLRDFKITPGDIIKDIENKEVDFDTETKEKVRKDFSINDFNKDVEKEEPTEVVLRNRENQGLESLYKTNEINDNLNVKQKELIEKLKKKGYIFKEPSDMSQFKKKKLDVDIFDKTLFMWKKEI